MEEIRAFDYFETSAINQVRVKELFQHVVSHTAKKIPESPDPSQLLGTSIKLGSLLISSPQYRQSLYTGGPKKSSDLTSSMDWL